MLVSRADETGDPECPGSPSEWLRFVSGQLWPEPMAASRIRPLEVRVAHRSHLPSHVLFTRSCGRCPAVFDYCGSCQPGRLYCDDECSEAARAESVQEAHAKFNDRESPEGREIHRLEEKERRDRQAGARVGDQRCSEETGELEVPASVANQSAAEARDAKPERAARAAVVEWILVATPELLEQAQERLGTEATCPFCGRRGRIVRVVSLDQWRRRTCRDFG